MATPLYKGRDMDIQGAVFTHPLELFFTQIETSEGEEGVSRFNE
jgi:hypothetical protein